VVTAAGGRIEDRDGGPPNPGPGLANVLATNGRIHGKLSDVIRAAEGGRL
jgi:fructose-1,6-bisphosphatase/inositol monophosphatase family enzyme